MPEDMPDKMPEDMSDRMPEDLPVTKRIDVMVGITRSKVFFYRLFKAYSCSQITDPNALPCLQLLLEAQLPGQKPILYVLHELLQFLQMRLDCLLQ